MLYDGHRLWVSFPTRGMYYFYFLALVSKQSTAFSFSTLHAISIIGWCMRNGVSQLSTLDSPLSARCAVQCEARRKYNEIE